MRTHLLTLLFISLFGIAHANPVDSVKTTASTCDSILAYMKHAMLFNEVMPQEKVYLHLDNTGYFEEETIWFKAYVVRADKGMPTDLSKVLYVELLNSGGDVISTQKCAIIDGQANGNIKLDNIFVSGFYEIRAYTRYMTSWGAQGCYSRVVPIFNKPKIEGDYSEMTLEKFSHKKRLPDYREDSLIAESAERSVSFYPEGGNTVKGLPCTVAFQLNKYFSNSSADDKVTLKLIDSRGGVMQNDLRVDIFGRGRVKYIPDEEDVYLQIESKGETALHVLPKPYNEGIVVSVDAIKGQNVAVCIRNSESLNGMRLRMNIQHGGVNTAYECLKLGNGTSTFLFPRDRLDEGVNVLSVYDENGHTIAERMFFVTPVPKGTDSISVSAKTERLRPCSKVEMQIKALPHTTLSFSAMDASTMTNGKEGNIRTWMLLSSELRGYIANPDYYFEADDSIHRMAADLLMMVQGWRKYQMPQNGVLQPVEDCLNIYGRLTPLKKKKTVEGVELCVKMYNKNGEVLEGETTTDSLGRYLFTLPDCNGEWNVLMYTSKDKKREKYRVKIDRHFSPTPRFIGYKELEMPPAGSPTMFVGDNHEDDSAFLIPLGKRTKVLPTVKVKAKRIYENARAAWETESKGKKLAQIYYNCDLETEKMADLGIASPDFLEWIKERNPLIDGSVTDMKSYTFEPTFFTRSEDVTPEEITEFGEIRYHRTSFYEGGFTYNNRPIVWIINNSYFMTTGMVKRAFVTYIPNDIGQYFPDFLDEAKSVYISADNSNLDRYIISDGLRTQDPVMVFVYTHHTYLRNMKGLRRTYFQGYNEPQTFQMEDYSVLPPMEDFRRTLYWNPNVKTDSEGKATIEFYNNSSCTEMFISAEGMTNDGRFVVY